MAFVRRFTEIPTNDILDAIEAINIVDIAPPQVTAIGAGRVLLVGETEDGPFASGDDSPFYARRGEKFLQVFGGNDLVAKYGGFGFTYADGIPSQNPAARRSNGELWNGSAFIKLRNLRFSELVLARPDVSVGTVTLQPIAGVIGTRRGPFVLANGDTLLGSINGAGASTLATITAVRAARAGASFGTTLIGDRFTVSIDGGPAVPVTMTAGMTVAAVVAAINAAMGITCAAVNAGQVDFTSLVYGTGARIVLADVVAGSLVRIGHTAGTSSGTGNVANASAVLASELATVIGATSGIGGDVINGFPRVTSDTVGTGSIQITGGNIQAQALFPTTQVQAQVHASGIIPAGSRVRTAGGLEWVTMQSLTVPAGTDATTDPSVGPWVVKVRPANDIGTAAGTSAGTITTLVDQIAAFGIAASNPTALAAALSEVAKDTAYSVAFAATLAIKSPVRRTSFTLSARRSDAITTVARQNAIDASNNGLNGRKYVHGVALGLTLSQATALLTSNLQSDRLYYCWPYWKTTIPEIRALGTSGGVGFTEDGVISVRSDGPLASLCSRLPPEEDPGQATGLISEFFAVDSTGEELTIEAYTEMRAQGICGPRVDEDDGSLYQSGVTSSLDPARTEINRRNMADYLQDNYARICGKYSKKLSRQTERDALVGELEAFLENLLQRNDPEKSRIAAYSIDATQNTQADLDAGRFTVIPAVKTLSSLRAIVVQAIAGTTTEVTEL